MKIQTNIHLEEDLKKESQKILIDRGETLSQIINLFLKNFVEQNQNATGRN